jgi:hypothetical protein
MFRHKILLAHSVVEIIKMGPNYGQELEYMI